MQSIRSAVGSVGGAVGSAGGAVGGALGFKQKQTEEQVKHPVDSRTGVTPVTAAPKDEEAGGGEMERNDEMPKDVRVLMGTGPEEVKETGCKAIFCVIFKRLFCTDINTIKVFPREKRILMDDPDQPLGPRAAQFVAWRTTLMWTGAFFFAFMVGIELAFVIDPWGNKGEESIYMANVDPRYRKYFTGLDTCNWINSVGLLVASCFSVVFALGAAIKWHSHVLTRHLARGSWMCSYLPPFVLLLVIPFRSSVDFKGIQVQMCKDMMDMTEAVQAGTVNFATSAVTGVVGQTTGLDNKTWWPGKFGTIAQDLFESYQIQIPQDFCDRDPTEYGTGIREILEDSGFLAGEDGTCRFSRGAGQELSNEVTASINGNGGSLNFGPATLSVSANPSCPTQCMDCVTTCLPQLMRLSALANIYGPAVLTQVNLGGNAMQCVHCVDRGNLQCPYKCAQIMTALDSQAILGMIPAEAKGCVQPEQMADFELLVQIATQTAYWRMLLGTVYAALSLASLLPLAFSLMLGAAKGASIAKSLIPYSRVPSIVSAAAAVFTFPFVVMIFVLVQNVVGNWLTLIGIILILIAFLTSMKPGSLRAESTDEMQKRQALLGKIGAVTMVLAILIFVIVLLTSDIGAAGYNLMKDQGLNLSSEDLKALRSQVTWLVIGTVSTVLGKSLISTVFFTDAVVTVMHHFHIGEERDPLMVQCARGKLVHDLDSCYKDGNSNSVQPVEGDSDGLDLLGKQQADMDRKMQAVAAKSGNSEAAEKIAAKMQAMQQMQAMRMAAQQMGAAQSRQR
mmetsp:Transcript_68791/g.222266  ORF Transcript_68791/g.222266 Transcript_68791/m.222266 type:complete len:790 (-) Transcript_68791:53-2422(-)